MQHALVLDGHLKSALAVVRSLGGAGVSVSVGALRRTGMALHSRFAHAHFVYPSPYENQVGFVEAIEREAIRLGEKPVIFALSDVTYLSLYTHRERLSHVATLIFPDEQSVEIAFDKAATMSLARVSAVPTIQTYTPATDTELHEVAKYLSYPAIVKSRRSVTWQNGGGGFASASFVMNPDHLTKLYKALKEKLGEAPLIQERVNGEEYGVEMIAHHGEPIALAVHHRLRSLSPTGGASVLKEIEGEGSLHDMLMQYARKLVLKLKWEGPIMVEFKVDSDTRTPKLMEINGRFWGSLPLSVAAGVDMPYYFFMLATENNVPTDCITAREGVVTRHFLGDVLNLFRVLFARDPMRPILYPTRRLAFRNFFKVPKGTKSDVWSWRDPKPALMEYIDIIKKLR